MQRQGGRHFADDIFECIFLNENIWIPIIISLKFVPKGPINNIPAMVQIMAWRHPEDKPLSEPMVVSLPTHICVARPQWVIIICQLVWNLFFSDFIIAQTRNYMWVRLFYFSGILAIRRIICSEGHRSVIFWKSIKCRNTIVRYM